VHLALDSHVAETLHPFQRTLRAPIGCAGVGLHSGRKVSLTLLPAEANQGIAFRRVDLADRPLIPARWDHVVDTRRNTAVGLRGRHAATVSTVEHLLAALAGTGVDNAIVELDGPEVPIMDGSAAPFVFLIECAGLATQAAPRHVLEVLHPVHVEEGEASITVLPDPGVVPAYEMEIDFPSRVIRRQHRCVRLAPGAFKRDLARARTFGFVEEIAALRDAGLARGGSLDNAVVLHGAKVLNDGGLRYTDEFVRHKLLDLVGDFALAGAPLRGRVIARRAGHRLNVRALQRLFAEPKAYRVAPLMPATSSGDSFVTPLRAAAAPA